MYVPPKNSGKFPETSLIQNNLEKKIVHLLAAARQLHFISDISSRCLKDLMKCAS